MKIKTEVIYLDSSESEIDDKVEDESAKTSLISNDSSEPKRKLVLRLDRIKVDDNNGGGDNETASYPKIGKKRGPRAETYVCTFCKKELVGMSLYKYHMKYMHRNSIVGPTPKRSTPGAPKRTYACTICNKEMPGKKQIMNHLMNVHGSKYNPVKHGGSMKCPICSVICDDKGQLDEHLLKDHNTSLQKMSPFSCLNCGRLFSRYGNLVLHEKVSHGATDTSPNPNHRSEETNQDNNHKAETYPCIKCKKKFSTQNWLIRHEYKCHSKPKRVISCSFCSATFNYECRALQHEKTCRFRFNSDNRTEIRENLHLISRKRKRRFTHLKKSSKATNTNQLQTKPVCTAGESESHNSFVKESANSDRNEIQKRHTRTSDKYESHHSAYDSSNDENRNQVRKDHHRIPRKCTSRVISYTDDSSCKIDLLGYYQQSENQPSGWVSSRTPGGVRLIYADSLCCYYCPKFFSTIHGKVLHEKIHTGDNPFQCKYCQVTFRLQQTHLDHENKCLSLIGTIWCPLCNYQNKSRDQVENHCISSHKFDMKSNKFISKDVHSNHVQTSDDDLFEESISSNHVQISKGDFLQENIPSNHIQISSVGSLRENVSPNHVQISSGGFLQENIPSNHVQTSNVDFLEKNIPPNHVQASKVDFLEENISPNHVQASNEDFLQKNIPSNHIQISSVGFFRENISPNHAQISNEDFLQNNISSKQGQTSDTDRFITKNSPSNDAEGSHATNFIKVEKNTELDDVTVISDNEAVDNIWSDFIIIDDD